MSIRRILMLLGIAGLVAVSIWGRIQSSSRSNSRIAQKADREEVVFWHFWGGRDRDVVEGVVDRFNQSQSKYYVRAIAMPGNNLQAKLFLAVTGGDPPDLVNQDDPILADWASRGVIQGIDTVATADEMQQLKDWMYDSAARLSTVDGRFFGVCNGLDIRALYYNQTLLEQHGLSPPTTLDDLDTIAETLAPAGNDPQRESFGYLPDSRRLWAWGHVFGGSFYDFQERQVTADSPEIVAALDWMKSYSLRYGADNLTAFRQGDQSLPGKTFPLLPLTDDSVTGRYALIMDGQWRTRDIREFTARRESQGLVSPSFGVCPSPYPEGGRQRSGWVNGNFFVVPAGAKCSQGAWQFIKFWIGMERPNQAAITCAQGGWIPVSGSVVAAEEFQQFLQTNPLFGQFVELAASPEQFPTPPIAGAAMFKRTVESTAYQAMTYPEEDSASLLKDASRRIQKHLERMGRRDD